MIRPFRSAGGTRLYSEQDVVRLQLLKALTESGEAIGTIADLDDDDLRARLALHAQRRRPSAETSTDGRRMALLEPDLARQVELRRADLGHLSLVARTDSFDALVETVRAERPDVVVVGLERLEPDPMAGFERCLQAAGGAPVVVAYTYARTRQLDQLARAGARFVRLPIRLSALRQRLSDLIEIEQARAVDGGLALAAAEAPSDPTVAPGPRLFSDEVLSKLVETHSSVDCECPTHLASIVQRLVSFEAYSAACLNDSPRDAELHAHLARATGYARAAMEKMLARLCEHDGIRF